MDQTVIIAINSGVGLRMIGNTGHYVKEFSEAMKFMDEIETYEYIERHGLEKISSVRKLHTPHYAAKVVLFVISF